jgi:Cu/Ag efflux protein CusF
MMKVLKPLALAGTALAATSLTGLAQEQGSNHGGCFVTLSPTEATRGIRHWRPPSSCVDWYKRIANQQPTQANSEGAPWVRVVVRKVDLPASRITVSHGAIPQIRMPAMTIQNIPVADAASLASLHEGDELDIQCEHRRGVVRVVNFRMKW